MSLFGYKIICPNVNCGYKGKARAKAKGSVLIALLLLVLGIIPGLIYIVVKFGNYYYCPKCGVMVGQD